MRTRACASDRVGTGQRPGWVEVLRRRRLRHRQGWPVGQRLGCVGELRLRRLRHRNKWPVGQCQGWVGVLRHRHGWPEELKQDRSGALRP
jgi:hypothetical protein